MALTKIEQQVNVTAFYFTNKNGRVKSFPKKIEFDDNVYTFTESGLQILVQTVWGIERIFEMTDGHKNFRLKNDHLNSWTLTSVK